MKIRKTYKCATRDGKILNSKSDSQNDTYSCDYINKKLNTYTTDEQVIGTWLGEPLYRKVLVYSGPISTGQYLLAHNISNLKSVINLSAIVTDENGSNRKLPLVYPSDVATYAASLYAIDKTNIDLELRQNGLRNMTKINIILEYTKTTD